MEGLIKLLMESGILARTPRTGPYHVGITNQETIAAHAYRQSILAYFMAIEEKADVSKVLKMSLVHDLPEARTLNMTFVQKKYIQENPGKALNDQLRGMEGSAELEVLFQEYVENRSLEANVTNDANILEGLIEAKEFIQQGIRIMDRWFIDKEKTIKTKSGKKILTELKKRQFYWWK